MLYSQEDLALCTARIRREALLMLLCALPFAALAAAGFLLRLEMLCIAGCALCGAVIIFMQDMTLDPALRYRRYLREVTSGLSRQMVGTLVRVGTADVYEDGVNFTEVILNIYEDMDEEGERRFLLDSTKQSPVSWVGQDVCITSHGSYVLSIELAKRVSK